MGSRLVIHSTSTQWPYQPLPWEYAMLSTIPFPRLIKCWRGFKSTLRVLFEDMAFVNSLLRMKLAFRCETNTRDPEAYGPWHLAASGRIVLRFYVRKRKGKGSMYGRAIRPLHSTFLPKNILWRNGIIVFLRNNTEAFKSKVENAQQSVALRLTEIKHGSRRLLFQIRLEIRGLFDGACKANRKVQPITEPENGDLKLSHPNQILTAHSSHLQQIQAIHNQFKSLTVNYKWLTANQVKITHSKFKFDVTVVGHLREWIVY